MSRFDDRIFELYKTDLKATNIDLIQINVGYKCNMNCIHCHIKANINRTEVMGKHIIDNILKVIKDNSIKTIDITGGAPELNPNFKYLVTSAKSLGCNVIVRTNLTVFFEKGFEDFPDFYAKNCVELTASLPCYLEENVDEIRGKGSYNKSIKAIKKLNDLGYGIENSRFILNLVYNPKGAFLATFQACLEADYKQELFDRFGIRFNKLFALNNLPIGRFREKLIKTGKFEAYMQLLFNSFNPKTIDGLMCRHIVNIGYDGAIYDCDFNQICLKPVNVKQSKNIKNFVFSELKSRKINTDDYCFACAAGSGST